MRTALLAGSLWLHVMECNNSSIGYHPLTLTVVVSLGWRLRVTLGCFGLSAAVKSAVYVDAWQ